jgi:hypothetical protein
LHGCNKLGADGRGVPDGTSLASSRRSMRTPLLSLVILASIGCGDSTGTDPDPLMPPDMSGPLEVPFSGTKLTGDPLFPLGVTSDGIVIARQRFDEHGVRGR